MPTRTPKKDKYARCFQWLRDARAEMSREMAEMTPEERSAYIHAGAEKSLKGLRRLTPDEAKKERDKILYPSTASVRKRSARRKIPATATHS